jgi:hypothetical protein
MISGSSSFSIIAKGLDSRIMALNQDCFSEVTKSDPTSFTFDFLSFRQ